MHLSITVDYNSLSELQKDEAVLTSKGIRKDGQSEESGLFRRGPLKRQELKESVSVSRGTAEGKYKIKDKYW